MKKILLSSVVFLILILAGCSSGDESTIKELKISFVPSREPDEIYTATEPLEKLLKSELEKEGFTVDKVTIDVGASYEAVGGALTTGKTDVAFIPGGTYVLYEDDGAELLLTATRSGLNKDSENAADWNDGKPTEPTDEQVTYYRSLLITGTSDKGQELAAKVNADEELTFEDLNSATWCVQSPTSSAGYIYPSLWLKENYDGKTLEDLDEVVQTSGYPDSLGKSGTGQCDITTIYADARSDVDWTGDGDIWEQTNVIGVTDGIFNDTISVSENSEVIQIDGFKEALSTSFINIANTKEGKDIISIYSHEGYVEGNPADYDAERAAQEVINQN